MKLLTKDLEKKLIENGDTSTQVDPIVIVKYFIGSWTWYGIEYDPKSRIFFGAVDGHEFELGSFSLDELEAVKNTHPLSLGVERDLYFTPKPLSEVKKELGVR
jgi:hypothetical protein